MKYMGKVKVLIPFMDGRKQYICVTLHAEDGKGLDKRGLLNVIRQYIKRTFKKDISNGWILKNCPIFPQGQIQNAPSHMKAYQQYLQDMSPTEEEVEAFIQRMKGDDLDGTDTEAESEGNTGTESENTGDSAGAVRPVQS